MTSHPVPTAAICGWAWRTPLGASSEVILPRLLAGERAAGHNPHFDASHYACTLAAAIRTPPVMTRQRRYLRRMGLHACDVAHEALAHAGLSGIAGERIGLFFGYGGLRAHWDDLMPALARQQADAQGAWQRGLTALHPFWMLQHLSNNAHAIAAQELQASGDGATFGGANAGAQALSAAMGALAAGAVDVALVVAYDTLIEPEMLVELAARGVASAGALPQQLAAPYAAHAAGFIPGEAAAALALRRPHAGALAQVQALAGADGNPHEAGAATLAHLANSLAQEGDWFDGAGLAQAGFDLHERTALAALAVLAGYEAHLACTLSAMGQLGAASAIVQAIALLELLQRRMLAPVAGLRQPARGPLLPVTQAQACHARGAVAVTSGAPGLASAVRIELC